MKVSIVLIEVFDVDRDKKNTREAVVRVVDPARDRHDEVTCGAATQRGTNTYRSIHKGLVINEIVTITIVNAGGIVILVRYDPVAVLVIYKEAMHLIHLRNLAFEQSFQTRHIIAQ